MNKSQAGFTLMEILVAFAILAVSLGTLMSVFNQGLQTALMSQFYAEAAVVAESRLAEISRSIPLEEGTVEGVSGRFQWQIEITPYEWPDEQALEPETISTISNTQIKPLHIRIKVAWKQGIRDKFIVVESVQLKT